MYLIKYMYTYIHICIHIRVYIYTHTHTHTYAVIRVRVSKFDICVCMCIHVHGMIFPVHTPMHLRMYVLIYLRGSMTGAGHAQTGMVVTVIATHDNTVTTTHNFSPMCSVRHVLRMRAWCLMRSTHTCTHMVAQTVQNTHAPLTVHHQ
jgi:hypothetical protein